MSKNKTAIRLAIRYYLAELWRQRKFSIPSMLLVSTGSVFTTYVPPLVIAAVIRRFGDNAPTLDQLLPYLFAFAGAWLFGEALWRATFLCFNRTDAYGMNNLYNYALDQLKQKDLGFFHDNFAGSLTKKALGFGSRFEGFVDTIVFNVARIVFPVIFASIVLWQFSPWVVVALFTATAILITILIPLIKSRQKLIAARETASNVMAGHLADVIGNMDTVQAFAHEKEEQRRHTLNVADYTNKAKKSWDYHTFKIDLPVSPIYVLINVLGLALAVLLSDDAATTATIFVTFNYFANLTLTFWEFNRTYRNLENAITDAAQFTELLLEPPKISDAANPQSFEVTRGEVEFKNVNFTYGKKKDALFNGFNLHIKPSEKIALVGRSGGGKTSITKLLLRFVDINGGELLIDGQDIAKSKLADVRSSIAYVPQEPAMFHRTIRENIRYGRLEATDEEVTEAARKAHALEFIEKLPDGFDTMVGERGVKLSGGQRQRIAIARAIIKDAPILVLDEATSALDSESEKLIQSALWELMKNRTAIVIAHRLSTIQKMDRIIVLENGKIIEQGSHAQLLKKRNGTYAKLWAHQSGGFIEE